MVTQFEETKVTTQIPSIPHSIEAEEALIGSILINPEAYYDVAHLLRTDDLYLHRLRFIWEAFVRLHEKRTPIDILTVSEELDNFGKLGEVGGPAYLTKLVNYVPTSLNATHYAEIVVEKSISRKGIAAANRIAQTAYDETKNSIDVIDALMQEAIQIANHSQGEQRLVSSRKAAEDEWERMERVSKQGEPIGVRTGYADIDSIIKSMAPGNLNVIAGRPGMGKTSLLQSIVHNNISRYEKRVLVAQVTDIDRDQWMQRLMSMESEIPLEIIQSAKLEGEQTRDYLAAFERVSKYPFMIDDTPSMTVEKLLSVARRAQAFLHGLDLIVVDYIQKMGIPNDVAKRTNRVGEIDHITTGLKFIARELDVPILAAAQLSRAVEQRAEPKPKLSDLRESGALEQDAQLVMFIYREDQYKPDTTRPNIAEIVVAKNTNGRLGAAELTWRGTFTRFENLSKY